MNDKAKEIRPPQGLMRFFYRMPIAIYRVGLGRMLGQRFLYLTHTGRQSGKPRHTVLEVIRADKTAQTYFVVSAYGKKADWYRNILVQPSVHIQVGGKKTSAFAETLTEAEALEELQRYYQANPRMMEFLVGIVGHDLAGEGDLETLAKFIPVVAIRASK